MKSITSAHNPQYKIWKFLLESRGAKKEGLCLVSGRKIVPELMVQFPDLCQHLIVEETQVDRHSTVLDFEALTTFQLKGSLFRELDEYGTDFPLLVMRFPSQEDWNESGEVRGLEVLAALGEPSNLGALFRSCEAFGVTKVILLKECVFPFHPKVIRSSAGSAFRVKLARGPSIHELQGPLVVLDKDGQDVADYPWQPDTRLLVGEEGRGIPSQLSEQVRVSIPMQGYVESLNAVAATSIALFSYDKAIRSR